VDNEETLIELDLHGFTYADRPDLLPELSLAIETAGGWVLERRHSSSVTEDLYLEVPANALSEVYAALLASGLELTRSGHRAMAQRCNCNRHLSPSIAASSVITIGLEIHFLVDPMPLLDFSRMLTFGAAAA
jgi:hypothetical protein